MRAQITYKRIDAKQFNTLCIPSYWIAICNETQCEGLGLTPHEAVIDLDECKQGGIV